MSPLTQQNYKQYWPHRQRGAVMVLVVVALAAILMMGALALDGGHMLLNKARLQNAVDAAALSGAKTLQHAYGGSDAATRARIAAWDTLARNAAAEGNGELGKAIGKTTEAVSGYAEVKFSNSVYGPFSFPGPADAKYVRVSVPNYPLQSFFWNFARFFKGFGGADIGDKSVEAVATAGPSPSAGPCKIEPIMVCGDPDQDPSKPESTSYWGYNFGDLEVLKTGAGDTPAFGDGNFQLLRLDGAAGANDLRTDLAGGVDECNAVGNDVPADTEPGNKVAAVVQGLNTRFGDYTGSPDLKKYRPDYVTGYNDPKLTYNDKTSPPQVEYQGNPVTQGSVPGDLVAGGIELEDINDWLDERSACPGAAYCNALGEHDRRMLNIVIGNCEEIPEGWKTSGQMEVPVLDFGCFFLLQTVTQKGDEAQVFGQFKQKCEGDGVAGPDPANDVGPEIIQLYKTYIGDGAGVPSKDS